MPLTKGCPSVRGGLDSRRRHEQPKVAGLFEAGWDSRRRHEQPKVAGLSEAGRTRVGDTSNQRFPVCPRRVGLASETRVTKRCPSLRGGRVGLASETRATMISDVSEVLSAKISSQI